mmetsp:Transcript_35218/g.64328  ORF Transcript_35218/g.64328 Transcript_35218/m.64328 type:complete len:328 (-) Transcript_35218:91-1074(-)
MDFDELDEADDVILNNQPKTGTTLPLMRRSMRVPGLKDLPWLIQKRLPPIQGQQKSREPKLRLLCMMGAADNVCQEWCYMEQDAPEFVEMATQEPPGHGMRKEEPVSQKVQTLGDDAFEGFKEAMDTGPFVLLGHSIGTLTATYLAERAKRELNVQPLFVILMERGAPHLPAFNEYGFEMLKTDPVGFMKIRDPSTAKSFDTPLGEQALRMWSNDLMMEMDTRPIGWFKFNCPLLIFRCSAPKIADLPPETRDEVLEAHKGYLSLHSERDYLGHFGKECHEAWAEWTDHPKGAEVVLVEDANHMSIKSHAEVRKRIWAELKAIVDAF